MSSYIADTEDHGKTELLRIHGPRYTGSTTDSVYLEGSVKKKTKLRLFGGLVLLVNLLLIGHYNLQGIEVLLLTFGFAIGYELFVVKNVMEEPSPKTHIRCPDCKELVVKEARVCKHCGCKLIPQ